VVGSRKALAITLEQADSVCSSFRSNCVDGPFIEHGNQLFHLACISWDFLQGLHSVETYSICSSAWSLGPATFWAYRANVSEILHGVFEIIRRTLDKPLEVSIKVNLGSLLFFAGMYNDMVGYIIPKVNGCSPPFLIRTDIGLWRWLILGTEDCSKFTPCVLKFEETEVKKISDFIQRHLDLVGINSKIVISWFVLPFYLHSII